MKRPEQWDRSHRIGAEQEFTLVDRHLRAAPIADRILKDMDDEHFVHEFGLFNAEMNLDPQKLEGTCFSQLEQALQTGLEKLSSAAEKHDAKALITGILPTFTHEDFTEKNMTPHKRYIALMKALKQRRKSKSFHLRIRGEETLRTRFTSPMVEAATTSFQVHFQTTPESFAKHYNIAQLIAGPVLAASANSPVLLGRKVWHESRIALFQQTIDTHPTPGPRRFSMPRVTFGDKWVSSYVNDMVYQDLAQFGPVLATDLVHGEDVDEKGQVPKLSAFQQFSSTVYRWNRPRYGQMDGKATLRIEARYLPSGPTTVDETANAALWVGLMVGMSDLYSDFTERISHDTVSKNFYEAARLGLDAKMSWFDEDQIPVSTLLEEQLLPIAEAGLMKVGVLPKDIQRYLRIITDRVGTMQTGASWALRSLKELPSENRTQNMVALCKEMLERQMKNKPVHLWSIPTYFAQTWPTKPPKFVDQVMNTSPVTVMADDVCMLAERLMIRGSMQAMVVEDNRGYFRGILNLKDLAGELASKPVSLVMKPIPHVTPKTPLSKAWPLLLNVPGKCLPVTRKGKLLGVLTELDYIHTMALTKKIKVASDSKKVKPEDTIVKNAMGFPPLSPEAVFKEMLRQQPIHIPAQPPQAPRSSVRTGQKMLA